MTESTLTTGLQLSVRAALAAGLAVAIAELVRLQYPLYALVGAVIVTDLSAVQTRQLGLQRLAGTVLGAAVGATFSGFLPPSPATIGLGILAAMSLSHLVRLQGAAKVTGYVCGIVVLEHHGQPWSYALYRLVETVLGIGMALLVSLVPTVLSADAFKRHE
jgi:uncharacterized membrane protein YgaE (UPF0421/DUF939 family)